MCYTVVPGFWQVQLKPSLSVIRGGQRDERPPQREPQSMTRAADERETGHSAEACTERSERDAGVISLMDGWLRVLERQARSIKP